MTLLEITNQIAIKAYGQPAIRTVIANDVFRINKLPSVEYGVFAFLQGQHSTSTDSSLISYSFTLFYVDRLRNDRDNELEIQSVGIEVLNNIIRNLEDDGIFAENSYSFQVFNQRFVDECAGVFCNVTFTVPVDSVCSDISVVI